MTQTNLTDCAIQVKIHVNIDLSKAMVSGKTSFISLVVGSIGDVIAQLTQLAIESLLYVSRAITLQIK